MGDRIDQGLRWLASQFSVDRQEFQRGMHPGGDMLLDGLKSHGYLTHDRRQDRYAVNEMGRKRLAAAEIGVEE